MKETWLIAGLGNPGPKYTYTWHNLGFMVLDILAQRHHFSLNKTKFRGQIAEVSFPKAKAIFLTPHTFMNLSGESMREAAAFYKIPPDHCLVIFDDFDIPLGTIRIRQQGSGGTHNGMRNVVSCFHTENIPRIRVGYKGSHGYRDDVVQKVLSEIPKIDQEAAYAGLTQAADAVEALLDHDLEYAMQHFNHRGHDLTPPPGGGAAS